MQIPWSSCAIAYQEVLWGLCGGAEPSRTCSTRSKLSENIANLSSAVCTSASRIAWLTT